MEREPPERRAVVQLYTTHRRMLCDAAVRGCCLRASYDRELQSSIFLQVSNNLQFDTRIRIRDTENGNERRQPTWRAKYTNPI